MSQEVRKRRADRVRQGAARAWVGQYGKYLVIALVVVAAIAGASAVYKPPVAKKFIHEHPTFAVFVNGARVPFTNPAYDAGQSGMDRFHMHQGQGFGEVVHVEGNYPGGVPDVTFAEMFDRFGLEFRQGHLTQDSRPPQNGSAWADGAQGTWRMYLSKAVEGQNGPFEAYAGDYTSYAPRSMDKVLFTYGTEAFLTPQELSRQQEVIPVSPDARPPG